ncbi:MAG: ATP-binding protein, partial [Luteitalea sp.]
WRGASPPFGALLAMAAVVGMVCLLTTQRVAWFRHGTQGRRLLTLYGALLLPALLLYPLLLHAVDRARRALVASRYAPQVVSHPRELLARLNTSLAQLDQLDALPRVVASAPRDVGRVPTDAAFRLWQQTDLARARLTSAVEIYAPDGPLVSRFGFNFPEYHASVPLWRSATCAWDVFGEAAVFGSEERSMLHAERAICETDAAGQLHVRGGIILHVMLDYSSLPFLSTQGPYYDLFRTQDLEPERRDQISARDLDLVVYGWGRSPIYSSNERVWELPPRVFDRAYRSRASFWATQQRGSLVYDIHVANDRLSIYVVGFPRVTVVQHLVRLAEVATLAAMATILLLLVNAVLHYVNRRGPQPATLLVREVRASFTRKLFLAFVATSVIPVLTLAFVVRTFVASRLRADVEAEATRTASVAQRVIEEALALQQPALVSATALTDDVMVWISRVIKQDVNIFDGPTLLATSQRDLFAQGLLPERTPDTVYRAIALQRLPTFVGEDQIGGLQYLLAATPIRVGAREAILTVPMTLRQREIEEEIADLDRSVNLGAIVFILLGSALGYSMAGRIGDPVQRLTRASRRIAAGDLDQRVVARTADELQRLVEAFNSMAEELSRQREQLQRTNRLEAWAEMARQVAHDIKNPLTPIQLSAEHLRRVHRDRGEPLAPVLDACVDTILTQVRMLRQISSEFASFASSPTARLTRVALPVLVDEVLAGYRIGLPSNVAVQSEVPDDSPDVWIDRALLGRAMINIIENALHAMPAGGTVTVQALLREHGWVRVSLADTGVGMDDAALARLFEPYFSTKAAGTGLGLSIAKRNVELMGGRIDVQSRKGVGTVVSLDLPTAIEEPAAGGPGGLADSDS